MRSAEVISDIELSRFVEDYVSKDKDKKEAKKHLRHWSEKILAKMDYYYNVDRMTVDGHVFTRLDGKLKLEISEEKS